VPVQKNLSMPAYSRRAFLSGCLYTAASAGCVSFVWAASGAKLKAAIIGHTGHGNYGHELDLIFSELPNVEVVAVADPDTSGRQKAAERSKALRQYADYREMLEKERPDLISVAPRWTDEHLAMGKAALESGAHVIFEKPFVQSLADGDELLEIARRKNRKIAVAHQMRISPAVQFLKKSLDGGLVGDLLEIRAHGKQDLRAGGEDMIVLGTHLFDLMRLFAGDANWCSATIMDGGREVTPKDIRKPTEGIGPVLGTEVEARFGFQNGVLGSFSSRSKAREVQDHWGLQLIGTKGVVRLLADVSPTIYLLKPGEWSDEARTDGWYRIEGDPTLHWTKEERAFLLANRRLAQDWLAAIRENREPQCSGYNGMKAVEMALAVFQTGLKQSRVTLPLADRTHPLSQTTA